MISEGDFLRRPETGTEPRRSRWLDVIFGPADGAVRYVRSHGMRISEIMTRPAITVTENDPLEQVVHLMETYQIKRLPVLRRGALVGIVSRANLLRALASVQRGTARTRATDTEIRSRILAEIGRQGWSTGVHVDVVVRKGLADLWGRVADPTQRDALLALAEGTPGVKSVVTHLRWDGDIRPT
jgi:hypothetical protein